MFCVHDNVGWLRVNERGFREGQCFGCWSTVYMEAENV